MIDYKEVSVVSVEHAQYADWKAILLIGDCLWLYNVYGQETILENSPFNNTRGDNYRVFRLSRPLQLNYRNPKETIDKFFKLLVIS